MEIKFDVYFKKNLGTLFKSNEVDLNGKHAHVNIPLALVDRMEINYLINGNKKYTDDVLITDVTENLIQIPFKSDVMKSGVSEFEIIAYMKNGDIKPSQTYIYNIEEGIGEGKQSGSGESNDGHTHSNLNVLNSITQSKISEWNNKADSTHSHSEYASKSHNHNEYANITHTHSNYASKNHTHNASEIEGLENVDIDLSDYYTKSETYNKTEIDSKIANMGTGGSVDLSNYYTKSETDEAMNDKANKVHTHNEYLTELPTHTHSEYLKELPTHEHSEYLTELPSHEHEQYLTEHQDISHKADRSEIPTKTSQLTNDSDYATNASVDEKIASASTGGTVDLSSYAKKTDLPTKVSQLENDSNFISSIPEEYVTEQELNAKGLATETFVANKIAEASIGGGEGSTVDLSGLGADLSLNGQTLKLKNSNGVEIGTGVTLPQTSGVSFRDIIADEIFNVFTIDDGGSETNIAVTGITINTHTLNIKIDEIISLHATINPNNAKNKNVIWATTNSNVELTPNGLNCSVKGINSGSCQITVTTEDGGYTDSCDIVVTAQQATDIITDGLLIDLDLRNLDGVTTTISDNSGNGNDFTMTNAVASTENSWQPGSASSGAYCNNLITASDYTVELYVKINAIHNRPYINIGKINWSSTIEGFKITPYNNGNNSPLVIVGSKAVNNYYPNFDMVDYVSANSFYHVVFTKQNLAVNVYIDGELKLSSTLTHDITMNNAPIAINGGCEDNLGTGFPNKLNKAACYKMFRLYNKALTAEEVKNNYDIEVTK